MDGWRYVGLLVLNIHPSISTRPRPHLPGSLFRLHAVVSILHTSYNCTPFALHGLQPRAELARGVRGLLKLSSHNALTTATKLFSPHK